MPAFSAEELSAVGAIEEWVDGSGLDDLWGDHWSLILGDEVYEHRLALVRLALAHPERAELAIGPGWRVTVGPDSAFAVTTFECGVLDRETGEGWEISVLPGYVWCSGGDLTEDKFAALARGRKVAATWRILGSH